MGLEDIGIKRNSLCEAIVTTFHRDGTANAAPMGVFGKSENTIMLKVHRNTDTYENILRSGCCVVNIVFDPLLFLRCALYGKHKGSSEIESHKIKRAGGIEAPYLEGANAYLEAELKSCEEFRKKDAYGSTMVAKMTLEVRDINVLAPFPIAPNRGLFAAIELAITLSRGIEEDIERYMGIIKKSLPVKESKRVEDLVKTYLASKP